MKRVLAVGRPAACLVAAGGARDDLDAIGHEVSAVEADAELADDRDVLLRGLFELRQERLRAGPRDGSEVLDELGLGHADARVLEDEDAALLVGPQPDDELGLSLEEGGLGDRPEPELVERIGGVRDQLAEEDLLVRVERVDDERQDTADLGLEDMLGHGARYSECAVRT